MKVFEQMGYPKDSLIFDPILIRGLDYYTGIIMETVLASNPNASSLGGGGRYDKMIGQFTGNDLPAVGYSVGLDRTIEAMIETGNVVAPKTQSLVLVTIFSEDLASESLKLSAELRRNSIPTELYLDSKVKLDKQLKYADSKGIPFVVVLGPDELDSNKVLLKKLDDRVQESLTLEQLLKKLVYYSIGVVIDGDTIVQ